MKNYILIILSLCLLLSACSKSGTSTTPSGPALNSTETKLVGYWYCSKVIDSLPGGYLDSTIASGNPYVEFKSSLFTDYTVNSRAKNCTTPYVNFAVSGLEMPGYWYYDETVQQVNISDQIYTIVTLNSTALILRENLSGAIYYIYLHK